MFVVASFKSKRAFIIINPERDFITSEENEQENSKHSLFHSHGARFEHITAEGNEVI